MVDNLAESGDGPGIVGLNPLTGETLWTFPFVAAHAWYFAPEAPPEVLRELVEEVIVALEPAGSDTVPLVTDPRVAGGDPAAARAFVEERYGMAPVNGRLLVLSADYPQPGFLTLLEPANGALVSFQPIDPNAPIRAEIVG
jgi:hypothetical protein